MSHFLREVGEDPLDAALKEAPRRRRSEVAPRSVFPKDPKVFL